MRSPVSPGISGSVRVERFSVSEQDAAFHNMRSAIHGDGGAISPGEYTRLFVGGVLMMSDTPFELRTNTPPVRMAGDLGGHVLISGLGLGCVLRGVLECKNVARVTVIERSSDVIALVGPAFYDDSRVEIVHADALTWRAPRGARYSVVWHDIWPYICADNLDSMRLLRRRFARRCDWQACWEESACRALARAYGW